MKNLFLALSLMLSSVAFAGEAESALVQNVTLADGRTILAAANGLTLYVFDIDEGSESQCYAACAKAWPALIVPADTKVAEPLGLTTRKDGSLQLTVNGHPVYFFFQDKVQGDIKGDGLNGVWHIIVQ